MKNILKNRINQIVYVLLVVCFLISCSSREKKEFSIGEIQRLSNLNCLECSFVNIAYMEGDKLFFDIIGTREQYVAQYKAKITLGIDLKEVEYDDTKKIIYVPKAKVLRKSNLEFIDTKYNATWFGTRIGNDRISKVLEDSLDKLATDIEKNDSLMNKAQNIAANQLENLINNVYTIAGTTPHIEYVFK